MRKLYLVGYDIAANGRRHRLLAGLRPYAQGGQKSAYECRLETGELEELRHRLGHLLDPASDRLILLQLDTRAARHALGVARQVDPALFYQG